MLTAQGVSRDCEFADAGLVSPPRSGSDDAVVPGTADPVTGAETDHVCIVPAEVSE